MLLRHWTTCFILTAWKLPHHVSGKPVSVAQGDAEVPGNSQQRWARDFHQSGDDDEDVDRCPAYDEDCHHHQDHAGNPA